jgi:hypothetical protein
VGCVTGGRKVLFQVFFFQLFQEPVKFLVSALPDSFHFNSSVGTIGDLL